MFGAGSVGGYLAGFLAQGGADVSVVARGAHLAAIRANGLTVETPDAAINVKLPASDDPAELGPQDAVHGHGEGAGAARGRRHHRAAARPGHTGGVPDERHPVVVFPRAWRPARRPPPAAPRSRRCAVERGRAAPRDRRHLLAGLFGAGPGVVRLLTGAGRGTVFGEPDGSTTPRIEALADAFRAADLPVTIAANIRELIWQKLAFNLSAGPMCVLTQSPVRATHEEPALIECSRRMLAEAEAMALAMGYRLDIDAERVVATNTRLAHRP